MTTLAELGWTDAWEAAAVTARADVSVPPIPSTASPARVAIEHRGAYQVMDPGGTFWAELPGKAFHAAKDKRALPAVGDWLLVTGAEAALAGAAPAIIHAILPRRGLLVRRAAGEKTLPQPLAANVDVGFVVTSANADLNPRRLERYLMVLREGGAAAVVVLNKIDLVDDPAPLIARLAACAPGAHVVATAAIHGAERALAALLGPGRTGVLVGSSGVGKSTLLNSLLGRAAQGTGPARVDDNRGRHTTTRRELFVLPDAGVLIDTPGMRELALWADGDDDAAWDDIAALAVGCKFADCRHQSEPGCAVIAAAADGRLAPERLAAFQKLGGERVVADQRRDTAARANERRRAKVAIRAIREKPPDKKPTGD